MKFIIFFVILNYILSLLVFPFKVRDNNPEKYASPINKTEIPILEYLYHELNDFEFVSEVEMGTPKQKVEVLFNFNDDYITLLGHQFSQHPYYYNLSSSYKELIKNDKNCGLKIDNSVTMKEILHVKNKFCDNLNEFISLKEETSPEFLILFNKYLPTLTPTPIYKYFDSNALMIGLLWNTRYNNDHGIYKPFLIDAKERGFIENQLHFLYYFDEYEDNLFAKDKNKTYDGLIVFGKYPHEVMPHRYDIKNLFWTNTFLSNPRLSKREEIIWGFKFNQIYMDYGNNNLLHFDYMNGYFDFNVEYIFPPYEYYIQIKNFFRPLRKICFIDSNARFGYKDLNIYRMVYCDYEEFGKKYLKTFPKLVFKIDAFDEVFEFTYKDLFKPIYDNKYYLFLIFTGRFWRATELIIQNRNYPWTLGRMFFKKYQFVFDSLNKRVGYYNTKKINPAFKSPEETNIEKEEIKDKKSNNDNNNNNNNNIKEEKDSKINENKLNKNEIIKDNKIFDSVFLVIFVVVLSIVLIVTIGFCYEYMSKKGQRKKRMNELNDETENMPKEELIETK